MMSLCFLDGWKWIVGNMDECDAVRTICRRGVQLIGTAHGPDVFTLPCLDRLSLGTSIHDVLQDAVLRNLLGGIQPVVISDVMSSQLAAELQFEAKVFGTGDDENPPARRRKILLQRKMEPSFDVVVEMRNRQCWRVYQNTADAIDAILEGDPSCISSGSFRVHCRTHSRK